MANTAKCPVCQVQASFRPITADLNNWACPRCGDFSITGSAHSMLQGRPLSIPAAVSGWIRLQNSQGTTPEFDSSNLDSLRVLSKPPFRERAERYLTTVVV